MPSLLENKELFPDDILTEKGRIPVPGDSKKHQLATEGPYVVCVSCPYYHTIPVDLKKWKIVLGELVLRYPVDNSSI